MDPISGDYVSMPSSSAFFVQNRERCYTLETILAKDASENTKKILFFQFMADLATDNSADESSNPSNKVYPGLCPCNFSSTGCMVCRNKNAKKGVISGTKNTFACIVMKHVILYVFLKQICVQIFVKHFIKEEKIGFAITSQC